MERPLDVDLNEIVVFAKVVQLGSFSMAAKSLGMPKSTVSRRVKELEDRVGARLLQRTTRSVGLTDVGRTYHEHASRIVTELEDAYAAVARLQTTPRGVLRVTIPPTFAILGSIFAEYLERYPEAELDVVTTDRKVDLVEERFDLALRAGPNQDSTLVARRVGTVRRCLLAAPRVVSRIGRVKDPTALERLPCITFTPEGNTWRLASGARSVEITVRPRLSANDYGLLRAAARAGGGLAFLPEYQCKDELKAGLLRRVLPDWSAPEIPVFALYPSPRHLSPKVAAMLDLIRARLDLGTPPG